MSTVADVVRVMNEHFPPALAEDWDRVGLVAGDPADEVTRVGFAVDPCAAVVDEAIERGAQMLITHHPLYLRGTSSVAADTAKGAWIHKLIRAGVALFAAHTNADSAANGSAVALAELLRLSNTRPIAPNDDDPALGLGRVGELELTMTVRELAERLKAMVPQTPAGITIGETRTRSSRPLRSRLAQEIHSLTPPTPQGRTCTSPRTCATTPLQTTCGLAGVH